MLFLETLASIGSLYAPSCEVSAPFSVGLASFYYSSWRSVSVVIPHAIIPAGLTVIFFTLTARAKEIVRIVEMVRRTEFAPAELRFAPRFWDRSATPLD
jgi:hypothetical protein